MRIAIIIIGNTRRNGYLNGYNLRYGGCGASGTDTSSILIAEYLTKQGHEVVVCTDPLDTPFEEECQKLGTAIAPGTKSYGVSYTNQNFDGIDNKNFDILISMLWFTGYENLPITVSRSLIYWGHMQWLYGYEEIIRYVEKNNLTLGIVNNSNWQKNISQNTVNAFLQRYKKSKQTVIPNPVFDEIINEVSSENIEKKKGKFIFHATWPTGGNVALQAIRDLDMKEKEFHALDYFISVDNHPEPWFHNHSSSDRKTVFKHLAESEYFIYPLYTIHKTIRKDTFALTVAEALALGVIVITYPLGALPETYKDYCAWLDAPPGADLIELQKADLARDEEGLFMQTDHIVEKIKYLEANPDIKNYYKQAGRQYILDNFNLDKIGKMWEEFIEDLAPAEPIDPIQLQKYDVLPQEFEIKNYNSDRSAFFYTFTHDVIGYQLRAGSIWEPHLHQIFEKYITKDSVVLEGGCHIGTHSIKLAMLANKLYCFEPLKESNKVLRRNILRNNCLNTTVYDVALSDIEGETNFAWMPLYNLGGSGLEDNPMGVPVHMNAGTNEKEKYPVKTVTIDSLDLDKLDFIKLDVEGYEPRVINGGIKTIAKYRPVITLECWANHFGQTSLEHTKQEFKALIDLNYSVEQVGMSDWLFLPL